MKMKKLLVVMAAMFAVLFCVSLSSEAAGRTRISLVRGQKWVAGVVRNGVEGDLAREVHVTFSRVNRRGKVKARPDRSVQATLAGGGSLSVEDLRVNRIYFARAVDVASMETLIAEPYLVLPGYEGKILSMPGIPAPPNPLIAQIAQLEKEFATTVALLQTANDDNTALQSQVTALLDGLAAGNRQIADQQAQLAVKNGELDVLKAQFAALQTQLANGAAFNAVLSQQLSVLQTQLSAKSAEVAALLSQNSQLMNLLAQAGGSNAQVLQSLLSQQAQLIAQNVALAQQVTLLAQQITILQQQLAGGAVISAPTVSVNSAFANPVYAIGSSHVRVASFVITAPTSQAFQFSSLTFDRDINTGLNLQNLQVMAASGQNATQIGTTRTTIGATESALTFSGTPFGTSFSVPAGGSIVVDLYADILSTSVGGTYSSVFDLTGWTATSSVSGSSVAFPAAVDGQNVVTTTGPVLTMTSWFYMLSPTAIMGQSGVSLQSVRLTANGVDDVRVTDVVWSDAITGGSAGKPSFSNFTLWDGTTQVAGPVAMSLSGASAGTVTFTIGGSGFVIPKNGVKDMVVKADVQTYSSGGAVSASVHRFSVTPASFTATSASGPVSVTGSMNINAVTVSRTYLSLGGGTSGAYTNRARAAVDEPIVFTLGADSAYQVRLDSVTVLMTGSAVPSTVGAFSVDLIDNNTNAAFGSTTTATATYNSTLGGWVATFTPNYTISAGTLKWTKLRVNSSGFANSPAASETFGAMVQNSTWFDGTATFSGTQSGTGQVSYE